MTATSWLLNVRYLPMVAAAASLPAICLGGGHSVEDEHDWSKFLIVDRPVTRLGRKRNAFCAKDAHSSSAETAAIRREKMNFPKLFLACAACMSTMLFVGVSIAPAIAGEPVTVTAIPEDARRAIVKYGDLDLASMSDQNRLMRRVGVAVRDVCAPDTNSLLDFSNYHACQSVAWTDARPKIASAIERAQFDGGLAAAAMIITIAAR